MDFVYARANPTRIFRSTGLRRLVRPLGFEEGPRLSYAA